MGKKKSGDISKQVYKFQEAITVVALESLIRAPNKVFWPVTERPSGVSVDVDILIGKSQKNAKTNVTLKHVSSHKDGTHAAWRMMREVIDTKSNGPKGIKLFNVVFDDEINSDWGEILTLFCDGHLSLQGKGYGNLLISLAYRYTKGVLLQLPEPKVLELLRNACEAGSPDFDQDLSSAVVEYSSDLAMMLSQNSETEGFWKLVSKDGSKALPPIKPRTTSMKRGAAKLLIFSAEDRRKAFESLIHNSSADGFHKSLPMLNLITENMDGEYVCDEDILGFVDLFGKDAEIVFETIVAESPMHEIEQKFVNPLRQVVDLASQGNYVVDNFEKLSTPKGMAKALTSCFEDPNKMLDHYSTLGSETTSWLFTLLMALVKELRGGSQAFGLVTLADAASVKSIASGFSVEDYVFRKKDFSDKEKNAISEVFSLELRSHGLKMLVDAASKIKGKFVQSILEGRLIGYKKFDPLGVLIRNELTRQGIPFETIHNFKTCANEFAETKSGGRVKVLVAATAAPTFLLWQAPSRNPRDKAKEYAAIIACLKNKWASNEEVFVRRGVRVFMFLDGMWGTSDIESLYRFGCDAIFRPDEIAEFGDAIARIKLP